MWPFACQAACILFYQSGVGVFPVIQNSQFYDD